MTVQVPILGGEVVLVDAADAQLALDYPWRVLPGHNGKKYAHYRVAGTSFYLHRLICGTAAGSETDHINGNGLDNRRVNLRTATPAQNSANTWKPKRPDGRPHTSRYKGVTRTKWGWSAKITVNQKCRRIGTFGSEADAARAYDEAAIEAWGEFARLNFAGREVAS